MFITRFDIHNFFLSFALVNNIIVYWSALTFVYDKLIGCNCWLENRSILSSPNNYQKKKAETISLIESFIILHTQKFVSICDKMNKKSVSKRSWLKISLSPLNVLPLPPLRSISCELLLLPPRVDIDGISFKYLPSPRASGFLSSFPLPSWRPISNWRWALESSPHKLAPGKSRSQSHKHFLPQIWLQNLKKRNVHQNLW